MKKRTNTAFWVEKEKRWCIAVQKNGTRKRFYSSTPGRTGQREANAKADAWLDDSIRDGKKKVAALYAQWVEELKLTCGTSYVEQCKKYGDYYILPVCGDIRIDELTDKLLAWTNPNMVSLSLPSLRADSFTKELMDKVASIRASSITFAPEAGSQRLRDVINKNLYEQDLMRAVNVAFDAGKTQVKLYFMQGHPTETDEDLAEIPELAHRVVSEFYKNPNRPRGRQPQVTISVSPFIPKPFTAFQWEPQDTLEEMLRKQEYVGSCVRDRKVKYNHHDARTCVIEAVLARGDRRLSAALYEACRRGFRFDAWSEYFDYDKWMEVFAAVGIDPAFYANRRFGLDEVLPWDVIDCGVTKAFLKRERAKAFEGVTTPNCREKCAGCGANRLGGVRSCCPKKE